MANSVLPDAARVLPPAGQKLWISAFNEGKQRGMPEDEASAYAWAAVKRAGYHRKAGGKWGKSMDAEILFSDDSLVIGVPFVKVNTQKRIVEGFATLDNIDKAGDIMDYDASVEAFSEWPGNIREMHQKVAVGKAVEITPKSYTDKDGTTYNGIWVKARISKGAEDTWQKVLDGTLAGFSIGGRVGEKIKEFVKTNEGDRECWRITKYRLTEVSLVDNPCNGLAEVSLAKSVDGTIEFTEEIEEQELEKMHAPGDDCCDHAELESVVSALESWRVKALDRKQDYLVARISHYLADIRCEVDSDEYEHKDQAMYDAMQSVVTKENDTSEKENYMAKSEEVLHNNENNDISVSDELSEDQKTLLAKFVDFLKGNKPAAAEETTEEVVEEVTKEDTPDMTIEEIEKAVSEQVSSLDLDTKFAEVGESLTKVAEALATLATSEALESIKTAVEASVEELKGRVAALENSGAVKKSVEDAGDPEALEKSDEPQGLWADSMVPEFLRKRMEF